MSRTKGIKRRGEGQFEVSWRVKSAQAAITNQFGGHPANMEVYDPAPRKRIDEDGAWVMITRELPGIEGGFEETVTPGRVFFAVRSGDQTVDGFASDGTYKLKLDTVWGTVWIWPYEYEVIPTSLLLEIWQARSLKFHPTHVSTASFNEVVHYCMSRGIDLATAAVMALGTDTVLGNIGWFEPTASIAMQAKELANAGYLTEVNHKRRRKSRQRRLAAESKTGK